MWPQNVFWTRSGQENLKKPWNILIRAQTLRNPPSCECHLLARRLTLYFSQQSSGGLGTRQSGRHSMSCRAVCSLVLCIRHFLEDSNINGGCSRRLNRGSRTVVLWPCEIVQFLLPDRATFVARLR